MKCPVCGGAELIHDTRDIPWVYKGQQTVLPAITGDYCPSCGEIILNEEQSNGYARAVREAQKSINAQRVDPAFITRIRQKMALDQREAAALFGGGTNAFSRYETGKTQPPVAMIKLFKLLDRHPELIPEVKTL
ncbi:type II toxin-antitoxin system MqsA family antitoxin [Enterobacteriaceae bacterium]